MNKYEPRTPRTTFGVIAFALTLITFGLSSPACRARRKRPRFGHPGTAAMASSATSAVDSVRDAAAVEVVGPRNCRARKHLPPVHAVVGPSRRTTAEGPGACARPFVFSGMLDPAQRHWRRERLA